MHIRIPIERTGEWLASGLSIAQPGWCPPVTGYGRGWPQPMLSTQPGAPTAWVHPDGNG